MSPQNIPVLAWHPVYDAHAIEQAVFYAGFDGVVDQGYLPEAQKKIIEQFSTDFPRQSIIAMPIVTMGIGNAPPVAMPPTIGGFVFQKYQDDGHLIHELRIDGANIAFRTLKYTKWSEVWGTAQRYFNELLPIYAKSARLNSIGLQYNDKFIQRDMAKNEGGVLELLRPTSPYISPHIYAADDLWHNYMGAFIRPDEYTKRLVNINMDSLDEEINGGSQRVVRVNISLTDMLNQLGSATTVVLEENVTNLCNDHIKALHTLNKEVLEQIISGAMAKRIGLRVS